MDLRVPSTAQGHLNTDRQRARGRETDRQKKRDMERNTDRGTDRKREREEGRKKREDVTALTGVKSRNLRIPNLMSRPLVHMEYSI